MATVCQQCGDKGFYEALIDCEKCQTTAVHIYCLPVLPASFEDDVIWFCEDCEPKVAKPSTVVNPSSVFVGKCDSDSENLEIVQETRANLRLKKNAVDRLSKNESKRNDRGSLAKAEVQKFGNRSSHLLQVHHSKHHEKDKKCRRQGELDGRSICEEAESVKTKTSLTADGYYNSNPPYSFSWSISYRIEEELKLHVDTALDNASSCKELLTHENLVEFGLASEDEMSGILARLKKRSGTVESPSSSSAPPKRSSVDLTASPVRVLPPPSEGERVVKEAPPRDSGTVVPVRSRSARSKERADFIEPYVREFTKHMRGDFVAELESSSLNDLANSFQRFTCQAVVASTAFKTRVLNFENKLRAENQGLKRDLEREQEELAKLRTEISTFEERAAMAESKAFQLEKELSMVRDELVSARKDLVVQRFSFEKTMEAETSRLQNRLDSMGNQLTEEYNKGLTFCYECIMSILGKEYPELNMSKLEAGVDAYMNEQDAKNQRPEDPTPNVEAAAVGTKEVAPPTEQDPPVAPLAEQDPPVAPTSQASRPAADPSTQAP